MADNKSNKPKGQGNANPAGASTTPDPGNKPGQDPTLNGSGSDENQNGSGQGNANEGGASTSPHPANQPGPDPTITDTKSTQTHGDKQAEAKAEEQAKADRANAEAQRKADLDKREQELADKEKALEEREARASVPANAAEAAARETQRQIEKSQKILDGPKKKITLRYRHTNVTPAGAVSYGPMAGSPPEEVEVPEEFADDLLRRDSEHNDYQVGLHQRRENILYSGTISGAGK